MKGVTQIMLTWNKISSINNNKNYNGNVAEGISLPPLAQDVLWCRKSYYTDSQDIYLAGYLYEGNHGLTVYDRSTGSRFRISELIDTEHKHFVYWAEFNKPFTKNNTHYAIAYSTISDPKPKICKCSEDELSRMLIKFALNDYISRVSAFTYIDDGVTDAELNYDWPYIEQHIYDNFSFLKHQNTNSINS